MTSWPHFLIWKGLARENVLVITLSRESVPYRNHVKFCDCIVSTGLLLPFSSLLPFILLLLGHLFTHQVAPPVGLDSRLNKSEIMGKLVVTSPLHTHTHIYITFSLSRFFTERRQVPSLKASPLVPSWQPQPIDAPP